MSSKKKRNKRYQGEDAAKQTLHVTQVSVKDRSKLEEYWRDNKTKIIIRLLQLILLAIVIWSITKVW